MTAWNTAIPMVPPRERVSSQDEVDDAISFRGIACGNNDVSMWVEEIRQSDGRRTHSLDDDQRYSQRQTHTQTGDDQDDHLRAYRLSVGDKLDSETVAWMKRSISGLFPW
jgi:hypothetical protein